MCMESFPHTPSFQWPGNFGTPCTCMSAYISIWIGSSVVRITHGSTGRKDALKNQSGLYNLNYLLFSYT